MKILFLDQSGKLGGAELCLLDIAQPYKATCLVGLLADGPFRERLEQEHFSVQVLTQQSIQVRKESRAINEQVFQLLCEVQGDGFGNSSPLK